MSSGKYIPLLNKFILYEYCQRVFFFLQDGIFDSNTEGLTQKMYNSKNFEEDISGKKGVVKIEYFPQHLIPREFACVSWDYDGTEEQRDIALSSDSQHARD